MHDARDLATAVEPAPTWKRELASALRDPDLLIDQLGLPGELREPARRTAQLFPFVCPQSFISRMRHGDPSDPLLRQVLPLGEEETDPPGYSDDPVGDAEATAAAGLLRKYEGRALLITTGSCAINCRYCFRRHFPYETVPRGVDAWESSLDEIRRDTSLREVILSGGDPLVLSDHPLKRLLRSIESIEHVRRLRVHSRLPIVLPSRVTDELLTTLRESRLTPWFVVHANHPAELSGDCAQALERFVDAGIPVLNQAVLLRGVNDDERVLSELCERLIELRVQPYYLHQLDRVRGAAHFHVPEERGLEIVEALRKTIPGYAVPKFIREVPGAPYKVEIR